MSSHITVGIHDLPGVVPLYGAVMLPIGLKRLPVIPDSEPEATCWSMLLRASNGNQAHMVHRDALVAQRVL